MSKTVCVLSRTSKKLIAKLEELLPLVNFIDVSLTDLTPLKTSKVILADYDLIGPHLYDLKHTQWVQGTWAGLDFLWPFIKKDDPPKFPILRTSGENFGRLMGEYVYANIVFQERQYFKIRENQQRKIWDRDVSPHDYRGMNDLKIGILGLGSIGNYISKTLNQLGATIYGLGRRESIPLETDEYRHVSTYFSQQNLSGLLESVDYIVNVLPKTEETNNLLGNGILERCKGKNVIFINIGRGNIIKESELIHALKEKWISGAILDVFETEPLPKESPLWDFNNVFITPHVSGNSRAQDVAEKFRTNYENYVKGLPFINQIDFEKGY
ncbi:glyoxylate/hydroxypyruvate reductase A-like [Anthonomus grandis grandis]|uniref:glyoxylate/hydroxypyruvate reductase A-like n=1 Tax=Anthonomus grandis grandis TaxID=2921223 RepID=UPI002165CE85|nr:glyoxylate/hydroxypyruvate reductase A-like [Anthonomus grandis grandis]